jgi:hypothetical protein
MVSTVVAAIKASGKLRIECSHSGPVQGALAAESGNSLPMPSSDFDRSSSPSLVAVTISSV